MRRGLVPRRAKASRAKPARRTPSPINLAINPSKRRTASLTSSWYKRITSPISSGSSCDDSRVESAKSQNITVNRRRSAPVGSLVGVKAVAGEVWLGAGSNAHTLVKSYTPARPNTYSRELASGHQIPCRRVGARSNASVRSAITRNWRARSRYIRQASGSVATSAARSYLSAFFLNPLTGAGPMCATLSPL
jgi:hypothetical protein